MAWMWENVGARRRSWTVGWRDHEGKKQQETFATKSEARSFKTLKQADRVRGLKEPSRLLFADW